MKNTSNSITGDEGVPLSAQVPIALNRFIEQSGLSPVTLWRYRKNGWLNTIIIAGRHYVTRKAIADFNTRAEAGEFAGKVITPRRRTKDR